MTPSCMLLLFAVVGCPAPVPETGGDPSDTGDTGETGDTSDTRDTSDPSDTGDTSDTGACAPDCGEDGLCELPASAIVLSNADRSDPHTLTATSPVPGVVEVVDHHFADGCCPTVTVTAVASQPTSAIEPAYSVTDDLCDCYTGLTVSYTLSCVPAGSWELRQGGETARVVVE